MNNYYVYMYLREDGTPYYVGKGKDYRAYHRTTHGLVVLPPADRIKKVLQGLTEEQAFRNEADFIAWYGRLDNNTGILENRTDGGDGISGYKHTKETKERLRQSSTGRYYSEETRKKISDNNNVFIQVLLYVNNKVKRIRFAQIVSNQGLHLIRIIIPMNELFLHVLNE